MQRSPSWPARRRASDGVTDVRDAERKRIPRRMRPPLVGSPPRSRMLTSDAPTMRRLALFASNDGVPMLDSMRVLVIWPPHVPSYFNAGHRMCLFEAAGYLRREVGVDVSVLDAGALNLTWKDVADTLMERFDVIALANEYDALDGYARFVRYARELTPSSRVITFGRLSHQIPRFFRHYSLDAVVESGDVEPGLAAYVRYVADDGPPPAGVAVKRETQWLDPAAPGALLPPAEWVLPDVDEIPHAAYDRLYRRDANKFCGIPGRRELVVPVARGCPIGCEFCDVPGREGLRERRLPVERVVSYIADSFARSPFEYVAMYAPTFTLNRKWVHELSTELAARAEAFPWKCTTTLHHLDELLVTAMAQSGCMRISVGLETLDAPSQGGLPRVKRIAEQRLEAVAGWCRASGVELNCFVIVGLPGSSVEGTRHTVARVLELGGRVRPTIYTPYHRLRPDMDEAEVASFNRQLLVDEIDPGEAADLYPLLFGPEEHTMKVVNRIASAAERTAAIVGR
jgi:anaerobic magnesium-protoporphyrin IX monomethyl ester cyclase